MKNILLIVTLLILFSCNEKNPTLSFDKIQVDSSKTEVNQILNNKEQLNLQELNFEDLGFELMGKETLNELRIGLTKIEIEEILGVAPEISTDELWEADGQYHQTYFFKNQGIELDMIGDNDKLKKVNMITITHPCNFKTSKNIAIGSKLKDLQIAYVDYFNKEFSDNETFVAGSIYGGVIFSLKNDKVTSIFIGAAAE